MDPTPPVDQTTDALREFFNELNAITRPIGAEELTKAKNYVALGFPSEFETIQDLASHIEEMVVYTLPDQLRAALPQVQSLLERDFEVFQELPGSLSGGAVFVLRSRR